MKNFMKLLGVSLIVLVSSVAYSKQQVTPATIPPAQKAAFENLVRDYLLKNPEILLQASLELQKRQQDAQQKQAEKAITKNAKAIFASSTSPVVGNAQGKVTLVEFFDYQCIHCKRMSNVIDQLVKDNPNLKVIYKQFPIFGETSQYAAKAALAAQLQGSEKFLAFHTALMNSKKALDQDTVLALAKKAGLDTDQLAKDINAKSVQQELDNNFQLANKMGIRFTPVLIVSNSDLKASKPTMIPGEAEKDTLQKLITNAQTAQQ